jgi:hypothetical protein
MITDTDLTCPRCGGRDFEEHDCGPDGWDDDVTWISEVCTHCRLWYSGWTEQWLIDCAVWTDEEDAEEFVPQ